MNLITGATGIIGAHLALECLLRGDAIRATYREGSDRDKVRLIMNFWSDRGDELFDSIEWVEADILDVQSLNDAVQGCDTVYHCAAMVSFHPRDRRRMMEVNHEGTANVVNACLEKSVKTLCYTSSVAALGRHSELELINEESDWKDSPHNSAYAISKHKAELEVWRGIEEGLEAVMVNPVIVIGPGDIQSSSNKIFKVIKGGMPFYTKGLNGFVDVRDVAECMRELVEQGIRRKRFVMVGENIPFREMMNRVAEGFGVEKPKYHLHPQVAKVGAQVIALKDRIFRTKSNLSPESVRNTGKSFQYDASALEEALGKQLRPVGPIVRETCRFFQKHY
jgi:nucleoside-diphosphate-sugar epimerase